MRLLRGSPAAPLRPIDCLAAEAALGGGHRFVVVFGARGLHWMHAFALADASSGSSSSSSVGQLPALAEEAPVSVHLEWVQARKPDDAVLACCFLQQQEDHHHDQQQQQQQSVLAVVTAAFSLERIQFATPGEGRAPIRGSGAPRGSEGPLAAGQPQPKRALSSLLQQHLLLPSQTVDPSAATSVSSLSRAYVAAAKARGGPPRVSQSSSRQEEAEEADAGAAPAAQLMSFLRAHNTPASNVAPDEGEAADRLPPSPKTDQQQQQQPLLLRPRAVKSKALKALASLAVQAQQR
ncbi:hypothetical protein Efla_007899 [Eimeria flavescens]